MPRLAERRVRVPRALRERLTRRSPEALALVALCLGAAVLLAVAVVLPMSAQAPVHLGYVMIAVALAMALGTWVFAERLPRAALAGQAALAIVLNSILVAEAHTAAGAMVDAVAYVWLMAYAALFFPRLAAAFVALIAAAFGLGLLASDIPGMLTPWVLVSVTTAMVGAVLAGVSRGVRRHLQTDTLTGTLNRDGLQAAAGRAGMRARRRSEQITVAALDLDAFKQINDRGGHAAGDRLLTDAAAAWRAALRSDDILARIGGDEFVVIMPGTSPDEARTVLARLRQAHPVGWSAGVACWRSGESLEACLQRADRRLYANKGLPGA